MTKASFALALALLPACTSTTPSRAPADEPSGARAIPAADLVALDATHTQLGSMLAGRPALVSLWATWCDTCREEMPALIRLDAYARERGAVVVGVAVGEGVDRVTRFVADRKLSYAQLVDADFRLADALGERSIPTTLVVDRAGRIVYTGHALDDRALAAFRVVLERHD